MDVYVPLGIALLVAAAVVALYAAGIAGSSDAGVRRRLGHARREEQEPARLGMAADTGSSGWGRHVVTTSGLATIERDIQLAGRPAGFTVGRILALKIGAPALTVLLGLLALAGNGFGAKGFAIWFACFAGAYVLPGVLIGMRATARQEAIDLALPDVLDQLTISIDAGLSLESAIARTAERSTGPLAEELQRAVQDTRLGMTRHEAYVALSARTESDNLHRFVRSIIQAQDFGVPVSQVVRQQADELRMRRQLRAEAAASKVPVKLLFPMMVCIFPVLFIIALVPPIVNAMSLW